MNMRNMITTIVVVSSSLAIAEHAEAQSATQNTRMTGPAEVFGAKGELAISSDAALSIQRASTSGVSGGTTTVQLAPAFDYFVAPDVSIGGFLGFNYSTAGDNSSSRFSIGPRVGYNIPFSDLISFWPKLGFSYANTSTTVVIPISPTVSQSQTNSASAFALNLYAPVMFHPATHFFAGFGPFLDTDLSGDAKTTVFGAKLTIGGWLL
jgi:hypothetical protein